MNSADMKTWLAAQMRDCETKRDTLARDGRMDEANFEKIRANVFGIFDTVLDVAEKNMKGNGEAAERFFASRLAQIPQSWYDALETAQKHGDETRAHVERIKIRAAEEIREQFLHGTGENA